MSMPPLKTLQAESRTMSFASSRFAGERDAVGDFAQHRFVEEIVLGAVERHASDALVDAELYEFELFRTSPGRAALCILRR